MKKALIVGYGFVGKATEYFLTKYCSLQPEIYDPYLNMTHLENEEWDFVFLCVPTNPKDGRLFCLLCWFLKSENWKWPGTF